MMARSRVFGGLLCAALMFAHEAADRAIALEQQGGASPTADTAYLNADVVTMDETLPAAQAIAVKGKTILAAGTNSQIQSFIGDGTKVVDLKGATVLPGFIDPHSHFLGYAFLGDIKHFV